MQTKKNPDIISHFRSVRASARSSLSWRHDLQNKRGEKQRDTVRPKLILTTTTTRIIVSTYIYSILFLFFQTHTIFTTTTKKNGLDNIYNIFDFDRWESKGTPVITTIVNPTKIEKAKGDETSSVEKTSSKFQIRSILPI